MRVTSKAQVTVPKALPDRFGITRETRVRFVAGPDAARGASYFFVVT